MAAAKKPAAKKPAVKKTYTQAEVEEIIKKAFKEANNPVPNAANRRKMMEQMQQEQMDRKMKEAAKRRGVPMTKKVKE